MYFSSLNVVIRFTTKGWGSLDISIRISFSDMMCSTYMMVLAIGLKQNACEDTTNIYTHLLESNNCGLLQHFYCAWSTAFSMGSKSYSAKRSSAKCYSNVKVFGCTFFFKQTRLNKRKMLMHLKNIENNWNSAELYHFFLKRRKETIPKSRGENC